MESGATMRVPLGYSYVPCGSTAALARGARKKKVDEIHGERALKSLI